MPTTTRSSARTNRFRGYAGSRGLFGNRRVPRRHRAGLYSRTDDQGLPGGRRPLEQDSRIIAAYVAWSIACEAVSTTTTRGPEPDLKDRLAAILGGAARRVVGGRPGALNQLQGEERPLRSRPGCSAQLSRRLGPG
jgi:hypothetical protein